jgi:hypothetical protein
LVNTDILQLLRESRDPESVFALHLADAEQVLLDMETTYESFMKLSQDKAEQSAECLQKKQTGDQEFFQ